MGKQFITDEVDDRYTARVTNAGKVKVETGAAGHVLLNSGMSVCGVTISSTPCWLKSVVFGENPVASASTALFLIDTSAACGNTTIGATSGVTGLFGISSGANWIARMIWQSAQAGICAAGSITPRTVPFDIYCSSGLVAIVGDVAQSAVGGLRGVTINYQT